MADRESTAVGYRLRMQPSDLSTYPDSAKLVWFDLVVKYGLDAKLRDLRRGRDKDGQIHPLAPRTIKYRKSEVGPVTKTAPRGIPALDLSRVISLLVGRAHTSSAEFWWKFDSVTGASFAKVLHYWADDQGHDVFGLSAAGRAWTLAAATKDWVAWKASPEAQRLAAGRPGIPAARQVRRQVPKVSIGRTDLENIDLAGNETEIRRAISEGTFTGFRRLNARGEQWKPGHGLGPGPAAPPAVPRPKPPPKPKPVAPVSKPIIAPPTQPVRPHIPVASLPLEVFARKALAAARLVPEIERWLQDKVFIIDAFEQFRRAYPDVTLEEFKIRLLEAHRAGHIKLARVDTPGWGGPTVLEKDRASNIAIGQFATFQAILVQP